MRRIEKLVPDLTEVQKKANEVVLQEYNQELQEILVHRMISISLDRRKEN